MLGAIGFILIARGIYGYNIFSIVSGAVFILIGTIFFGGLTKKQITINDRKVEIPLNSIPFMPPKNIIVDLREITLASEKLSMEFIVLELKGKKTYRINSWFLTEKDYEQLKTSLLMENIKFENLKHDIKTERKKAFIFLSVLMTNAVLAVAYFGKFQFSVYYLIITTVLIVLVNLLSYGIYRLMPEIKVRRE